MIDQYILIRYDLLQCICLNTYIHQRVNVSKNTKTQFLIKCNNNNININAYNLSLLSHDCLCNVYDDDHHHYKGAIEVRIYSKDDDDAITKLNYQIETNQKQQQHKLV